jgi:hypothetical protein
MDRRARIIAAVLVIVVAAGTTVWWVGSQVSAPVACGESSQGNTPLGTATAIGTPVEQVRGLDHWYNFSVASTGGGDLLDGLTFEFRSSTGGNITPGPNWTLNVVNASGSAVGAYVLVGALAGHWSAGGTHPLRSDQVISLLAEPGSLSGDHMLVVVAHPVGPCSALPGSISVSIP